MCAAGRLKRGLLQFSAKSLAPPGWLAYAPVREF
jgi:hypothetical protein